MITPLVEDTPFGELTVAQCVQTYAEQAEALSESGVDFLLLETFFALDEALAAVNGALYLIPIHRPMFSIAPFGSSPRVNFFS